MQRNVRALSKIILLVLVGFAVSSCRFGNRQSEPGTPEPDYSLEYYRTVPVELQTFAVFNGQEDPVSVPNVDINLIPEAVRTIFTDPVGFLRPKNSNASPAFFSTGADIYGQATGLHSNGSTIQANLASSIQILYDDPNCLTQIEIEQIGELHRFQNFGTWIIGSGEQVNLNGRLSLQMTVFRVFLGTCQDQLNTLAACITNAGSCDEEDTAAANALFSPFLQSGVIDLIN